MRVTKQLFHTDPLKGTKEGDHEGKAEAAYISIATVHGKEMNCLCCGLPQL